MSGPDMNNEPMPMDMPPMDNTQDIGSDLPQDEPMPSGGDDAEINNVISKLSTEDKAAVLKYAKSMVKDDNQEPPMDNMMGESTIVTEITNEILDDKKTKEKKSGIPIKNSKLQDSPFKTKQFK